MNTSSSKKSKNQTDEFYKKNSLEKKKREVWSECFFEYSNNYIKCNF